MSNVFSCIYNIGMLPAELWTDLPAEIKIFLLSMLPVWELRGSLPLAIHVYGLSPLSAFLFSFLGNFTAGVLLIFLLDILVERIVKKVEPLFELYQRVAARTSEKHRRKIELYAELGIFLVVALPLPGTGAWTGALLSRLFRLNRLKSILSIGTGLIACGTIVLLLTVWIKALT